MSTSREELADRLEAFLRVLESARRCENKTISVWSGDVEVVTEALEVARLAATPKAGVNVTDDSLAKTVTTAVLTALKAGGDNLAIFNAVKQALPSVLGGVDQPRFADGRQCNEQSGKQLSPAWQPIDTAPRNRRIMYHNGKTTDAIIGYCRWSVFPDDDLECWWDYERDDEACPKFWMEEIPLPLPKADVAPDNAGLVSGGGR